MLKWSEKMKEVSEVIARLWAEQIVAGKKTYREVPAKLKNQVADILREMGREDLIIE